LETPYSRVGPTSLWAPSTTFILPINHQNREHYAFITLLLWTHLHHGHHLLALVQLNLRRRLSFGIEIFGSTRARFHGPTYLIGFICRLCVVLYCLHFHFHICCFPGSSFCSSFEPFDLWTKFIYLCC